MRQGWICGESELGAEVLNRLAQGSGEYRMKTFTRCAATIGVAALLIGCSAEPGAMPPTRISTSDARENLSGKGGDLLYLMDRDGRVEIVSYPADKEVGSIYYGLYSYLGGECADRAGNVWITDYATIAEYRHGGTKPIRTRAVEWDLKGCTVAPGTDNLAAVGQHGTVFVWNGGQGRAKTYHTKSYYRLSYCGYDADGNLFVDGIDPYDSDKFLFFELPNGGQKLKAISLDKKIAGAGQVQWDGRYIAIQNNEGPFDILQVKVSGSTGTVVNRINLAELRAPVGASWIAGSTLFVPYGSHGKFGDAIAVFHYPAGGQPTRVLKKKAYRYVGAVTLSI